MQIPKTLAAFLFYFIKRQPFAFSFMLLTSIIWSVNESFFPYFIKLIVNAIHSYKGDPMLVYHAVAWPVSALVLLWLVMELSMRTQGFVLVSAFPRFRANIRNTVYHYVRQHSYEYFSNNFAGSVANKIADLPSSSERIMELLLFNFIAFISAFFIAILLLWNANAVFALIMISWALIHVLISIAFLHSGSRLAKIHSEAVSTLSGKIIDSLTNILNVNLFARGSYESRYLDAYQRDEVIKAKRALLKLEQMKLAQGAASLLFILSIIFLLVYGWAHAWVTLGDFTLVTMLAFNMMGFIWYLSYQMTVYVREAGKIRAALGLISVEHGIKDKPDATELKVLQGEICLHNVTFGYKTDKPVFENLSLTIKPGEKVGLVGFSGSGKSTFVNLILRLYDVNRGEICIDGQNTANVTRDSLRHHIAMIPQDPTLFHRSLMENIRYGRIEASDDEVFMAAKMAHCDEFISQLDEGYASLVGERGIKLSGGQRQRISISRAILKDAPILILDEATSSLDSVTEKLIQKSLQKLMRNRTSIVIAHRLSTLAGMDRILVFDQGKIIEDGTITELLTAKGHFAKLWEMQSDGLLPRNVYEISLTS